MSLVEIVGVLFLIANTGVFYFIAKRVWDSTFETVFDFGSRPDAWMFVLQSTTKTKTIRRPPPQSAILRALAVVVVIFVVDVGVMWALTKIGGPQEAQVNGTLHKFGANIFISAAGLVGCFLAVAIVGFIAVYYLSRR